MYLSERLAAAKVFTGKVSVRKERLNMGGYTTDGVYFGSGEPLYFVQDEDGIYDHHFRASCREDAIEKARDFYPLAQIRK
jgi:hypothetical protein